MSICLQVPGVSVIQRLVKIFDVLKIQHGGGRHLAKTKNRQSPYLLSALTDRYEIWHGCVHRVSKTSHLWLAITLTHMNRL